MPPATFARRALALCFGYYGAMGGDRFFWHLFGGIWLLVGAGFLAATFGINLFADPEALNTDTPLWLFALIGIVCCIGGAAVIYVARKSAARDRHLMQSGVELTATVIDIRRSLIDINRQTRWHVAYRYEYPKGQPREGKSRALPGEAVWAFKPGDNVQIKIDPQKPEESLFFGAA
ncbi:MAG: DUF3592 domain-containing protein [Hyphomicrobiales bacterium]|nr:DUF3592 domain-containing protein [Hyphomicrobiales bacterium]